MPGAAKEKAPASATPRRLSPKDRHTLKELPARIAKLEAEIATLAKALDDPAAFQRDPARFSATSARLGEAQAEVHILEDR